MNKLFLTLIFASLTASLAADEQEKHEFTFGGFAGLSALKPVLSALTPAGGTALGYNYFFNDVTGLSAGIELSFHRWRSSVSGLSDGYMTSDGEEPFEFRTFVSDYTEVQTATYLVLPLAVRFQYPLLYDRNLIYFTLGGKACLPLRSKYETSGSTFNTSAWYPAYNVLLEAPASRGLGTFTGVKQSSDLRLKTAFMLSAEAGVKWDIADQFSIYAGLYVDYGLNSVRREKGKPFLVYSPDVPARLRFNSMMEAQYTQDGKTVSLMPRTNPVAAGLTLRIAFKLPE
jgi:opacity protein-like surface antigen